MVDTARPLQVAEFQVPASSAADELSIRRYSLARRASDRGGGIAPLSQRSCNVQGREPVFVHGPCLHTAAPGVRSGGWRRWPQYTSSMWKHRTPKATDGAGSRPTAQPVQREISSSSMTVWRMRARTGMKRGSRLVRRFHNLNNDTNRMRSLLRIRPRRGIAEAPTSMFRQIAATTYVICKVSDIQPVCMTSTSFRCVCPISGTATRLCNGLSRMPPPAPRDSP